MSSFEPTDEPHEKYRYNGVPQNDKKRHKIPKILLIIAGIFALIILGVTIGFVALFISFLSVPSTDIVEALNEAWQSVLGWTKPLTDLYNQATKLIPGTN